MIPTNPTRVRRKPSSAVFSVAAPEAPTTRPEVASILTAVPSGIIDGGEIVILAIKPSLWWPIIETRFWLLASVLISVILLTVPAALPGLSTMTSVQLVLLIGTVRLAWSLAAWVPRWHVLTNRRIIDLRGIRALHVDSCQLIDIRNTYLSRGAMERIVGLGSITFMPTDSQLPVRHWRAVCKSDEVHVRIRRAIQNAIDRL